MEYKEQLESMVYRNQDLVKHGRNLPGYLQRGEKSKNTQDNKTFSFGVLDWRRLENWKSNTKHIKKSSLSVNNLPPESGSPRLSTSTNNSSPRLDQQEHLTGHKDVMFSLGDEDSHASSSHEQWLSESRKPLDPISTEVNPSFEFLQSFSFPKCPVEIKDAPLKDKSLKENKSAVEHLTTEEDCKNPGQQPYSSFSRRFSFSLEKIAPSFSFRMSSTFPQSFGSSPDLHTYNSKKGNATNIVKSISMRLLDPLLKRKGHHSAKEVPESNRKGTPNPKTSINEKHQKSSNAHALLHLTMKNGIPFFKLVVDNSSKTILAAAVKKLPSGKDDSSLTYTFHSLHEINNKNGGWKNSIVGKMKISSSYHAEFSGLERDLFVVRESVLYGPDSEQSEQVASDCLLTAELATIIVKNISNENYGGLGSSKSTVVILPGGVHSLPKSGKPSPLINRWRSGGACDCGGWDIGCELRVLTNYNESSKISNPATLDRFDLCYQGMHNNKHALSVVPLENGVYSLEYNASISLLQAFSICVAVVSSQNLTHIFQVNHLQDGNHDFSKPIITRYEKVENPTIVHAKIPPASPIGRV